MPDPTAPSKRLAPLFFYGLAILVTTLDQLVKALVRAKLPLGTSVPLWPGVFELSHVQNDGIAFSLLAGKTWVITAASMLIMLGIIVSERRAKGGMDRFSGIALGLALGGALGNLLDRLFRHGLVTDFLYAKIINFPIFNVADMAITIGIFLLAVRSFFLPEPPKPVAVAATEEL